MKRSIQTAGLTLAGGLLCIATSVSATDIHQRSLKFGYGVPAEHPLGQGIDEFIRIVNQKSAGKINIRAYPNNALGADLQMVTAARAGVQELVGASTAPLTGLVTSFALFDFPFLFANEKEADTILDGPVGRALLDQLEEKGLVGLCYFENGFRNTTNSKRPIARLEDFTGLKLRTMQSPVYLETFSALGANAIPMAFSELYAALDTKAIDAQENPYANIYQGGFYEVQKYLTATRHAYAPFPIMVSKKLWDDLTGDERTLFQQACTRAQQHQRAVNRKQGEQLLAQLQAAGMLYNELPPAEIDRMRAVLQPVIDKYTRRVGPALVGKVYDELARLRGQRQSD